MYKTFFTFMSFLLPIDPHLQSPSLHQAPSTTQIPNIRPTEKPRLFLYNIMSSSYGPVIVQNTRSSSSYTSTSRPSPNYSRGTYSPMDSTRSSNSGSSGYSERYRDGHADGYAVDVNSRTNRSGREVVVINQKRQSGSSRKKRDEPSSSDYGSSPSAGRHGR